MPRTARKLSESGLYHAVLRGNDRQLIFNDDEDRRCFLDALSHAIQIDGFAVHCYCLMDNHVHIVAEQRDGEHIGTLFRHLGTAYVRRFNHRHERVGHLFQDRFWSEPIESNERLLSTVRYIHLNPVRAGVCSQPDRYRHSSYNTYMATYESRIGNSSTLLTTELVESLMSKGQFLEWHRDRPMPCLGKSMAPHGPRHRSDRDALIAAQQALDISGAEALRQFVSQADRHTRATIIFRLDELGMSISQISRLTGMARKTIRSALQGVQKGSSLEPSPSGAAGDEATYRA